MGNSLALHLAAARLYHVAVLFSSAVNTSAPARLYRVVFALNLLNLSNEP